MHSSDGVDAGAEAAAETVNVVMGTAMMVIGSVLTILVFADRTDSELFPLPAIWHQSRDFHIVICVMVFAFAAILLKQRPVPPPEPSGTQPVFQTVRFFTRRNCELCDRARETLDQFSAELGPIDFIDIDTAPEHRERFTDCVPVLEIDGRIRFRGSVDRALLSRLIAGARSQRPEHRSVGGDSHDSIACGHRRGDA